MTLPPNRRDDEVRRLLNTPHPPVPVDLAARAAVRGRRIVRRRRIAYVLIWTVATAVAITGIVLAALARHPAPDATTPWWSQ